MKFLANENFPLNSLKILEQNGVIIKRVDQIRVGMDDNEVLKVALDEKRILLTFDKDFGEKIFKDRRECYGIILIRIKPKSTEYIAERIRNVLNNIKEIKKKFIVIEEDRVRVRNLKG